MWSRYAVRVFRRNNALQTPDGQALMDHLGKFTKGMPPPTLLICWRQAHAVKAKQRTLITTLLFIEYSCIIQFLYVCVKHSHWYLFTVKFLLTQLKCNQRLPCSNTGSITPIHSKQVVAELQHYLLTPLILDCDVPNYKQAKHSTKYQQHGLCSSACINGNWVCPWERANFDPQHNLHFSSNRQKFVTGDYIGDPYSSTKFDANPPTGSLCANGWNATKTIYLYIFWSSSTGQIPWLLSYDDSNDTERCNSVQLNSTSIYGRRC